MIWSEPCIASGTQVAKTTVVPKHIAMMLDPRRVPYRPDIAADWLEGQVESARFVRAVPEQVQVCYTSLKRDPLPDSPQGSVLLFGEVFDVYQQSGGWAWGQNQSDGYVGFVASGDLREEIYPADHRVRALRSFFYSEADLKSPALGVLSLNSPVQVVDEQGKFAAVRGAGWVFKGHLVSEGCFESDYVVLAERFVGTPYLWGGRTSIGIDCSGLVQMALAACGWKAPRDSDMQSEELGKAVAVGQEPLRRGDLVFFPGHVGIMVDEHRLLNATVFTMDVTIEPLWQVAERALSDGQSVTAIRRIHSHFTS